MPRRAGALAPPARAVRAVAALLLSVPRPAAGDPLFSASQSVVELDPDVFDAVVLSSRATWFVVFYADWCPHCQHFAPLWERAAVALGGDPRVSFGAVDCAVYLEYCAEVGIGQYPMLRLFNMPGEEKSFTKDGAKLRRGSPPDDDRQEEEALLGLLRARVAELGPAPVGAEAPVGGAAAPPREWRAPAPAPAPAELAASRASATLRLVDAEVALAYALRQGTAVAAARHPASPQEDDPLALGGAPLRELIAWLEFLAVVFPSARARRDISKLAAIPRAAQLGSGVLPRAAWLIALDRQRIDVALPQAGENPGPYWRLCATYTCGLWTLFHMVTVAAAQGAQSIVGSDASTSEAAKYDALPKIRNFVANFFGCEDCARHFLDMYDSCGLGRCDLSPTDARGAALWLWQVHNNVTQRVSRERGLAGERGLALPAPWPNRTLCGQCWPRRLGVDGGTGAPGSARFDPDAVVDYLKLAYTPAGNAGGALGAGGVELPGGVPGWAVFAGIVMAIVLLFVGAAAFRGGAHVDSALRPKAHRGESPHRDRISSTDSFLTSALSVTED